MSPGPHWRGGMFRGLGYRFTLARQVILDVLSKSNKHLSAEDIYFQVHSNYPAIGLTTVYRTLKVVVDMGLVFKFDFGDGKTRYELAERQEGLETHFHLICSNCGRIIDYKDLIEEDREMIDKIKEKILKKYHFKINKTSFQFYGLCEECNRQIKR